MKDIKDRIKKIFKSKKIKSITLNIAESSPQDN